MTPRRIEYEVGTDVHGRDVLLIHEPCSGMTGKSWTIHVLAANERDEDSRIYGLTREVILAMAEAVRGGGA